MKLYHFLSFQNVSCNRSRLFRLRLALGCGYSKFGIYRRKAFTKSYATDNIYILLVDTVIAQDYSIDPDVKL